MTEKLLTFEELEAYYQCYSTDIYRWIKEGMPVVRQGKRLLFDLDAIRYWHREGYFNGLPENTCKKQNLTSCGALNERHLRARN